MVSNAEQGGGNTATQQPGTGKLTHRQRTFAREYHLSGNATEAAKKAGYSEKVAVQQGSRLLRYVNVQAELARFSRRSDKDGFVVAC